MFICKGHSGNKVKYKSRARLYYMKGIGKIAVLKFHSPHSLNTNTVSKNTPCICWVFMSTSPPQVVGILAENLKKERCPASDDINSSIKATHTASWKRR